MTSNDLTLNASKLDTPILKLTPKNKPDRASSLSLNDLNKLILFKFGSFTALARKLQVSKGRVYQIFKGVDVPKSPKHINKIANVLDIDPIILVQVLNQEIKKAVVTDKGVLNDPVTKSNTQINEGGGK